MTIEGAGLPASSKTSARLDAMTEDQRAALASLLGVSAQIQRWSRGRLENDELSQVFLNGYAERIALDACRVAQVPLGPPASSVPGASLEYLLVSAQVEQHSPDLWSVWLIAPQLQAEVRYGDAPDRALALAVSLVLLAQSVLERDAGSECETLAMRLVDALDGFHELVAPDPTLEEKIAGMKERHAASLAKEQAEDRADNGPESSFHGEHVD